MKTTFKRSFPFIFLIIIFVSCSTEVVRQHQEFQSEINVYFNKDADTSYAFPNNKAKFNINFEEVLINRIEKATSKIDVMAYEINLPKLIDALIKRASEGIQIRFIIDAKSHDESMVEDTSTVERYTQMRLYLEKMSRGKDLIPGTDDDIMLLADSPIFTVTDTTLRKKYKLPISFNDYENVTLKIGNKNISGHLLVDAELKPGCSDCYYSPGAQMHNKIAIIDTQWVFTGSWNFTITGLYGTEKDMQNGNLNGNQNHIVEIRNRQLASIYLKEFEEMWGGNNRKPNPTFARFNKRKTDNTQHIINIDGRRVEVYFSPSDKVLDKIINTVEREANRSVYFTIFAFSYQALVDVLKVKWEGSIEDLQGERTNFDLKGIFDATFWNQWWSASINMTGRTPKQTSELHPMRRWKNIPPVYRDRDSRKLHAKTMIIDEGVVIVGSANWSENADANNDENTLIIYDRFIANQFMQEFRKR
ncbi:MAG: phospholipase D-like domain-containing protein [Melioribacteraceae bacterium]|nr:phospholipase D-like domain-containing protein [Melioribacteraceae bacterium]